MNNRRQQPIRGQVLQMLLLADLETITAAAIARRLHTSPSTLRRQLRAERTSYQDLLDRVRRHRCVKVLHRCWVPGKSLAASLGFRHPNSFYRAFYRWMGMSYTRYKQELKHTSPHSVRPRGKQPHD